MFSIITMASSTTKPTAIVSAHQRQVVDAVAQQVHRRRRCATIDSGTVTLGMMVAQSLRRNRKIDQHDKRAGQQQRELHIGTEARIVSERSETRSTWTERRDRLRRAAASST